MNAGEIRQAVAQLLVVRASGHATDKQRRYPRWELSNNELEQLLGAGVGGVILLGGTATELQQRCRTLQRWAGQPILLCADVEEGVGQRFEGASWLVPPMALGRLHRRAPQQAVQLAENYGRCCGNQAKRCGLNWVLAPVCDVNSNPDNPVINVRAWGEDPHTVGELTGAFQRGLAATGVLGCAKHFPGHGDTSTDSHLELPLLQHSRERLESLELQPFRTLIQEGVSSVMTAHLLIPALDKQWPATLSANVLTTLLRVDLGFKGLVVTDALVMEAIAARYGAGEAAVLAFAAGADLILMPADAAAAIDALCAALRSGRVPMARLHDSLERRQAAVQSIPLTLDSGNNDHSIESAEERSLTLELVTQSLEISNSSTAKESTQPNPIDGINLIRVDGVLPCPMLSADAPAILLPKRLGFQSVLSHPLGISPWTDPADPLAPLALDRLGQGPLLLQLFVRGNPFQANRSIREPWTDAIKQLIDLNRLFGLVVYGSPYIWEALSALLPSSIPAGYSPGQMPDAQQQLLERLLNPDPSPALSRLGSHEFTD
ncbi:MAG: glycoside hydrolase family 3 N-terminal domain-containing protein [Synechococcus sp.]|nr:MAG: glycosyl hydrolase family 3 [Synechococcus sp. MED-G68]|tara:strand:- start:85 stop:1725 length:1641 start_codon:yes stop_codon:yes gene_type:complete